MSILWAPKLLRGFWQWPGEVPGPFRTAMKKSMDRSASQKQTPKSILRNYCLHAFAAALAVLGSFLPFSAHSEGFRNPPPGTFNLGRAGGRIAHIDDSSAVHHNPANLVDIPKTELNLSPSLIYIHVDYESPSGQTAETTDPWKLLPNFFGSTPLADGKYAVGVGLTVPYGISNEWEKDGSAFSDPTSWRYAAPYYTELKTINVNPSAAIKFTESLRLGIGLDVMWSQVTFKQFFPWFLVVPGAPDGEVKAKGDGFGVSGNLGFTWQIAENHRLAATLRAPMDVTYDGHIRVSNVPGGGSTRNDFETELNFPTIVALGYGIKLTDTIRIESNIEWLQFSRFETLDLETGGSPVPNTSIRQDWEDTVTIGIGGDWQFAPNWVLRAGYQFYDNPVPDRTFSPTIPDANQHVFTIGVGFRSGSHAFEAAYGADFYEERNITDNQTTAFNGKYDINVHLLSFAYRFTF